MSAHRIKLKQCLRRSDFSLNVDCELPSQGITVVFGASGSGKTTLLRCVAGLEPEAKGVVEFSGSQWQSNSFFLPAHQRPVGYVFQNGGLFSHLSIRGNLDFSVKRASAAEDALSFNYVIDLLGIEPLLARMPEELSGGEQQRVAIARALLIQPQLLLMDEPLSSLDRKRKQDILPYLERLKRELKLPIIYVTHSIEELARLADHVLLMDDGSVLTEGALQETMARIDLPLLDGGEAGVVLEATITEREAQWALMKLSFSGGELWCPDSGQRLGEDVRVRVLARDVSLSKVSHNDTSIMNVLPAHVDDIAESDGASTLVRLAVGETPIIARLTRRSVHHLQLKLGDPIWVQVKSVALVQ